MRDGLLVMADGVLILMMAYGVLRAVTEGVTTRGAAPNARVVHPPSQQGVVRCEVEYDVACRGGRSSIDRSDSDSEGRSPG
jgi:hypothetical protein